MEKPAKANDRQEGGNHYKRWKIQPWDAILDWDLSFLAGNVVKYICRYRVAAGQTVVGGTKGGIEDLKKAKHYIDKLIETEEARIAQDSNSSTVR